MLLSLNSFSALFHVASLLGQLVSYCHLRLQSDMWKRNKKIQKESFIVMKYKKICRISLLARIYIHHKPSAPNIKQLDLRAKEILFEVKYHPK